MCVILGLLVRCVGHEVILLILIIDTFRHSKIM